MSKLRFRAAGIALLALSAVVPALADTQFRVRRMTRDDVPLGKGQCDIRLQVDGEVEVALRGDSVFIRTISGQESHDDGSECNAPLPQRPPAGFEFRVVDSRNEIRLLSEPSPRNNGAAIVRIRDSSGGFGRYHFRISWAMDGSGSYGGNDRPSFDRPGFDRPGPPARRDDDFPPDRRGGMAWNNTIHFSGPGRGEARMNGPFPLQRLGDVAVDIDRGGRIQVSFRAEGNRTLTFLGTVMSQDGDMLRADMATEDRRVRGPMILSLDNRRNVYRISLDAGNGRDRLRLDWQRR